MSAAVLACGFAVLVLSVRATVLTAERRREVPRAFAASLFHWVTLVGGWGALVYAVCHLVAAVVRGTP